MTANDAIEIHENVSRGLGAVQSAKALVQEGRDPSVAIGITEGYLQSLINGTAKMFCNIQKTSIEDIDEMIANGQLRTNFRDAYFQYSSNEKRGKLRQFGKWLTKIW